MYPTKEQVDKIKIIVCDLDGTLLNHKKIISKANEEKLRQLQQQGYIVVLASGRFYYELLPYIKQLQLDKYHGYVVCANGAEIHNLTTNEVITYPTLTNKETSEIIEEARKRHIVAYYNINTQYHVVMPKPLSTIAKSMQIIAKHFGKDSMIYQFSQLDFHFVEAHDLYKICFLSSYTNLTSFTKDILARYPQFTFYPVNKRATEITRKEIGKKQAVEVIAKQLSLTLENVLHFGDSGNDEVLLKEAGIGVAMKNAMKHTLTMTPYHSDKSNEQDGVADYLAKLFK